MKHKLFENVVLPVIKDRIAGARMIVRAALSLFMAVTVMAGLVVLVKSSHGLFSGKAQAAINPAVLTMTPEQKFSYARDLRGLLGDNPGRLSDLISQEVLLVLDRPAFQRRDGAFRMWQYSDESCVLDIYMKSDGDDGFLRIIHYELRERDTASFDREEKETASPDFVPAQCMKSLISKAKDGRSVAFADIIE